MRGFLCAEFQEYSAALRPLPRGGRDPIFCAAERCPGSSHLREVALVAAADLGVEPAALLRDFGSALFGRLLRGYPAFMVGVESAVDLAASYEARVVVELAKLDAGLRLPSLTVWPARGGAVEIVYRSTQSLADLAEGLLRGAIAHFGDDVDLERRCERVADGRHDVVFALVARTGGGGGNIVRARRTPGGRWE